MRSLSSLAASDGSWIIADPAFGKATWSDQEFRDRFTGDAIYVAGKLLAELAGRNASHAFADHEIEFGHQARIDVNTRAGSTPVKRMSSPWNL